MTDTEQVGAIATPAISQADIESLEKLYTFREPTEVLQFLEKYPFLVPLVLDAHETIRKYFPDSPLFLEYVPDPEIYDTRNWWSLLSQTLNQRKP